MASRGANATIPEFVAKATDVGDPYRPRSRAPSISFVTSLTVRYSSGLRLVFSTRSGGTVPFSMFGTRWRVSDFVFGNSYPRFHNCPEKEHFWDSQSISYPQFPETRTFPPGWILMATSELGRVSSSPRRSTML
jgi:hypothetical protein